jgi:hypothetical protein
MQRASVPSCPDDEADSFSETSVMTKATQPQIAEGGILQRHRRENLIS